MRKTKKASSILVAIFMTGFLLILVLGMFNLMLRDMKDNKGFENYLKSYAGAEGAMELGLLKIKEKGYGIDEDLANSNSGILSFNSKLKNNDPRISYKMDVGVKEYSGSLGTGATIIIPLFSNKESVEELTFNGNLDIIWNIVGKGEGMSGTGNFDKNTRINYRKKSGGYEEKSVEDFLKVNPGSYLILFNENVISSIEYKLNSEKNFSKPIGTIISSAQIGKFRQNITTKINNTEFLNMLKYSLYSK